MNRFLLKTSENQRTTGNHGHLPSKQKGAFTMFSAVLILILLTEMIIYAVQTGVFEQRKSANEMRQKEAFQIADSAIQFGKEFILANSILLASAEDDLLPDGTDGWLSASDPRWLECSTADLSNTAHPCYAEPADNTTDFPADLRNNMYYYSYGTTNADGIPILPVDVNVVLADNTQQVSIHALLCMLDIDRELDPIVQGCTTDPVLQDARYHIVTLAARGEADCDAGTCTAKVLITENFGSFGPGGNDGGGGVPLTSKTTFPPNGSAEIVPNPNGGGVGVPISAWLNGRTSANACSGEEPIDALGGSWATCERHEWYGVDQMTADFKCPKKGCSCGNKEKKLSWSKGGDVEYGIDLVVDENFPCDLFLSTFGVHKDAAGIDFVKYGLAKEVLSDCSSLDDSSFGVYWISGPQCIVNANTQIGTANAPVVLISAASLTRFNGGAIFFGLLFVTDAEYPAAEFDAIGSLTIYGAAVIDAKISKFKGTFQIVYLEDVLKKALQNGGFGNVAGSWTDFHQDWR